MSLTFVGRSARRLPFARFERLVPENPSLRACRGSRVAVLPVPSPTRGEGASAYRRAFSTGSQAGRSSDSISIELDDMYGKTPGRAPGLPEEPLPIFRWATRVCPRNSVGGVPHLLQQKWFASRALRPKGSDTEVAAVATFS